MWACPLQADWRTILHEGPPPRTRRPRADAGFVDLWQGVLATVTRVAREHDRQWLRRQRVLNTLLVMLFVFRLAFASDRRGYATVLAELRDHCRQLGVDLPQERPVSAAAICKARAKVAPEAFRQVHRAVLAEAPAPARWQGHRVFAVDGSKVNVPRPLVEAGYDTPGPGAHYPKCRSTATCTATSTSAAPPVAICPRRPPAMSSSTTAATTPLPCCTLISRKRSSGPGK